MKKNVLLLISFFLYTQSSLADQYHYNNILIGDRAIGFAGAYGGISDDASGVFYNPAGLAYALSNDISGSANAIYSKKVVYKKTVGDSDFKENSGGTLPSFFGGLQKLDGLAKGLVFAFGVYTTDSELKDQNDLIKDVNLNTPSNCLILDANGVPAKDENGNVKAGVNRPPIRLARFHRSINERAATLYAGGGLGWRIRSNFSVGVALNYVAVDELVQEYQDVRTETTSCNTQTGGFSEKTEQKGQNIRQHLVGYGVQPVLGLQAVFGKLSLGLTLKLGRFLAQSFDQSLELRSNLLVKADQDSVDAAKGAYTPASSSLILEYDNIVKSNNPLGSMPKNLTLGLAYFYSTRLAWSFDLKHYTAVTNSEEMEGSGALYRRGAVTDFATGIEYYLLPAFPLRVGLFTNHDSRPKIDKKKSGQADHIDYNGLTTFLAWVQPNSQVGAGVILQQGVGEAQKLGNSVVQTVEANAFTFAFSASHSF